MNWYIVCKHLVESPSQEWIAQGENGYLCETCHSIREHDEALLNVADLQPVAAATVKALRSNH